MDGHIHLKDLQLAPSTFKGSANYAPYLAEDTSYQQYVPKAEEQRNHYVPQWTECQQVAPHYVEYLAENGISGIQRETSYNTMGAGCSFKLEESFLDMGSHQVLYPWPQHEEGLVNNCITTQHEVGSQMQSPEEGHPDAAQCHPHMLNSTSGVPTKQRRTYSRQKANATDRLRRTRIATAIDALEEVLPQPKEGNKSDVLDDVKDYIKYLQLHMKELSQNRLGGESTSNPVVSIEGCGHYLVRENMAEEPLEDMLGKLLEVNPSAATKLLESRGLFMMPIAPM